MLVVAPDLRAFVARLFEATCMTGADALRVANVLVWADLRGTASHGVSRVPRYIELVSSGALNPQAVPDVEQRLNACFTVDGRRAAGPVALGAAVKKAIALAREHGVSFGTIVNTTHTGAIGFYAQEIATGGCAAIVGAAGIPNMAYHGARVAGLSTSPLAISVPARPKPLLLDMATSVVALGRMRQAATDGMLPSGWALDEYGRPTTNPADAVLPLPLGGAKGSGLSLMFECLSGVLAGAPILAAMLRQPTDRRHRQSAFVIALSVSAFGNVSAFEDAIADLSEILRNLPRQDGVDELLLPGERGERTATTRSKSGIPLSGKTWQRLMEAAARLGVTVPFKDAPIETA